MQVIGKQSCPTCHRSINPRKIQLSKEMVRALKLVTQWCIANHTHEFKRSQIKHLFRNETITATFGNWIYFGGILYKREQGRGFWGINLDRAVRFLRNQIEIPTVAWRDPITRAVTLEEPRRAYDVMGVEAQLNQDGEFVAEYKESHDSPVH